MKKHNLIPGSDSWHEFRLNHNGASEAAAMLGLSKKTSRNELLHMKATGTGKEFSDYVQKNILDYGHEVEALARPIVEGIIGEDLYPVTCSDGRLSASCDGLTDTNETGFEHKQRNSELVRLVSDGFVPDEHMPQCQQIMMVTGAKRVIFTVSDGTEESLVYTEVLPDQAWFERIRAGWVQFNEDLENYVPAEIAEMPMAEAVIELPALFIHARGEITLNNMAEFGNALTAKLVEVRAIPLETDQDFANAENASKMFREQIKKLDLTKEAMLSQTVTIGEASRLIDVWKEDLRVTALQLEKDVIKNKDAKKLSIMAEAKAAYVEHIAAIESEIKPIRLTVTQPDFLLAMKGKSLVKAWQNAADTALANARIAADAQAKDYREKLLWCKENAAGQSALFPDLQQIIIKPLDDFTLLITSRMDKRKADEAARLEVERAKIQAEEEAKAQAKVEARVKEVAAEAERGRVAEIARLEQEAAATQRAVTEAAAVKQSLTTELPAPAIVAVRNPVVDISPVRQAASTRPSRIQMIEAIAKAFNITYSAAEQCLREEFAVVAA